MPNITPVPVPVPASACNPNQSDSSPRLTAFATSSLLNEAAPPLGMSRPKSPDNVCLVPSRLDEHYEGLPTETTTTCTTHQSDSKTSSRFSTKRKAGVQLAAVTGTVALGAALAPFTLGFSLLPTVFVVMFGNAAAMAMYGGSQYMTGDPEQKKPVPEPEGKPDVVTSKAEAPAISSLVASPGLKDTDNTETEECVELEGSVDSDVNTMKKPRNVSSHTLTNAASNLAPQEQSHAKAVANIDIDIDIDIGIGIDIDIGTYQTTNARSLEQVAEHFPNGTKLKVTEVDVPEFQATVDSFKAERSNEIESQLASLSNRLSQNASAYKIVKISEEHSATAYAVMHKDEISVSHGIGQGTQVDGTDKKSFTSTASITLTHGSITGEKKPLFVERGEEKIQTKRHATILPSRSDHGTLRDGINWRIVGQKQEHIQYQLPEPLKRSVATPDGLWRKIPADILKHAPNSEVFMRWLNRDLDVYLNTRPVLLTQGAVSMLGQNYSAGHMNNVRSSGNESRVVQAHKMPKKEYIAFSKLSND